ncbi:hypothetical protein SAMN05660657_00810 [Geodermatophilus amargosae]|uniref:Tryptophan-associated transmembrane protein (Trp_oprn_chp) n=1 Tax=Geodermatophilus amargosae TaxID=1296565 RepID=A0A1I6Y0S8_9ACTN|nr:hypothetical protein [Geodermatophilus amargosae]SFT44219.1 hypothetical protein SAMN05660657_00810 [Geodermatophilus amargosae]
MTERDPSTQRSGAAGRGQTEPGLDLVTGSSAAGGGGYGSPGGYPSTRPGYSNEPVAVRGPESLGGLLLILAGIAAAVSLALRWVTGNGDTGWRLVRRGFDEIAGGFGGLLDTGFWQPLAVVLGGGVLFLLGILLWLPARTHRFLGFLALLVSGLAIAGVVVPLVAEGWQTSAFGIGFWFACAVGVLGLLGSLKALLTGRRYR